MEEKVNSTVEAEINPINVEWETNDLGLRIDSPVNPVKALNSNDSFTTASATETTTREGSSYFPKTQRKVNTLTLPVRKRSNSTIEELKSETNHNRSASFNLFNQIKTVKQTDKEWKSKINKLIKEKGAENGIKEFVSSLNISKPFNFTHDINVTFNAHNLQFNGLPNDWKNKFNFHFGSSISKCPRILIEGYVERIPAVLVLLKNLLHKANGYKTEGIFRIAPESEECAKIKMKLTNLSSNEELILNEESKISPHIISNLIKQFFRDLKPCLLDCLSKEEIIKIGTNEITIQDSLLLIKEPSKSVFLWLLDLLKQVVKEKDINRMSIKNLSIILSPNLFSADNLTPIETLILSQKAVALVTRFLEYKCQDM